MNKQDYKTTYYHSNGNAAQVEWRNANKELNNQPKDMPAITYFNEAGSVESTSSFINGKRPLTKLPVFVRYYSNGEIKLMVWYNIKGKQHNDKGPAHIELWKDGTVKRRVWKLHGQSLETKKYNQGESFFVDDKELTIEQISPSLINKLRAKKVYV